MKRELSAPLSVDLEIHIVRWLMVYQPLTPYDAQSRSLHTIKTWSLFLGPYGRPHGRNTLGA